MRQREGILGPARIWLSLLVAVVAAGCGTAVPGRGPASGPAEYPQTNFAHRAGARDIVVYWNCSQPEADVVRVDGVVQNSGGRAVQFVNLEAAAADPRERYVASAKTALPEIILHANQISPFAMELRVPAATRLDMYYAYRFTATSPEIRELARDACSPTQHRFSPRPF